MAAEQLREKERALEIGIDHIVPFGIGDVDDRLEQRAAGVVDQKIEVAQLPGRTLERCLDAVLRAQIERDGHGLAPLDLGLRQRVLERIGFQLCQGEVVALARQRDADGAAESGGAASYERASSFTHVPSFMLR